MNIRDLLDRLDNVKPSGTGWSARCPSHEDRVSSLSVAEGETQPIVLFCHARCEPEAIMAALGGTMADLSGEPVIVASYPYTDAYGRVLYTVHRWSPKRFTVEPTGIQASQRTLYQREAIEYARSLSLPLYLVEGEKDVHTLRDAGLPATTAPHGAGSAWLPQYTELLRGCNVVIVADNDTPGINRARAVYAELQGQTASVSLVKPSDPFKDATDLFCAGYGPEHLEPIAEGFDGLTTLNASEVKPKRVHWAWEGYIPFGAMTLIDGDPGSAKSTLTVDLVARWTSGLNMPDDSEHNGPHDAVMVSAEDDPETTIVPRLMAAGANLERVHLVVGGIREDMPFNLGVDTHALRELIIRTHTRYVILDPLSAFLPSTTDSKMDAAVRSALAPLGHMSRQLGFALVVVRHLTKGGSQAMYAGSGSVGFIAAARAGFLVTNDPMHGNGYKVLAPIKSNLAHLPESLSYTVEPSRWDPDVPRLHWHGEVEWSAQSLLDAARGGKEELESRAEAKRWLRATVEPFCENGGIGCTWKDIVKQAKDEGEFSEMTLRRARKGVLTKAYNPTFMGEVQKGVYWQVLPDDQMIKNIEPAQQKIESTVQEKRSSDQEVEAATKPADPEPHTLEWLDALPMRCDVCGREQGARKWGEPYWCVRCDAHNPRTYQP